MKYAQVRNGRVVTTQQGIEPAGDDWYEVQIKWVRPSDYPDFFYSVNSNIPKLSVVGNEVHENWDFNLKTVDNIKAIFYENHKQARYTLQLGSFIYDGNNIPIGDRETSLIIGSLTEHNTEYKIANNEWLTILAADIPAFKEAHRQHVQDAYNWEKAENVTVAAMTTLDELKDYLNQ